MAESSTLDALVAEMLGDIGKLHEAVEALNDTLPHQVEEAKEKLTSVITQLDAAGESFRDRIRTYVTAESALAKAKVEREMRETVIATLRAEIVEPMDKVRQTNSASFWRTMASSIVGAVFVFSVGLVVVHHYDKKTSPSIGADQAYDIHVGKQILSAWPLLDMRTRAIIKKAMEQANNGK